ncbi:MAG: response regulator transcription factor [Phycisphaerae bacterium]|jgi:DNA-binding NarL/FixJ family response regulator|nr:response regulator transcription factor [Phycisphaerae bacterium]
MNQATNVDSNLDRHRRLRIVCIDDNAMIASALVRRLESDPTLTCVQVVQEGNASFQVVREASPDIVLMDVDMPGVDTFAIVERFASELPDVRVIMFSGHVNPEFIDRALDAGAWGYLSKNEDVVDLIEAIRRAGQGEIVLSKEAQTVQRSALPKRGP